MPKHLFAVLSNNWSDLDAASDVYEGQTDSDIADRLRQHGWADEPGYAEAGYTRSELDAILVARARKTGHLHEFDPSDESDAEYLNRWRETREVMSPQAETIITEEIPMERTLADAIETWEAIADYECQADRFSTTDLEDLDLIVRRADAYDELREALTDCLAIIAHDSGVPVDVLAGPTLTQARAILAKHGGDL